MSKDAPPRAPKSFDLDAEPIADGTAEPKPKPKPKPRKPRAAAPSSAKVKADETDFFAAEIEQALSRDAIEEIETPTARPRFSFLGIATKLTGLVVSIAFGLWLESLVRSAFERHPWFGWAAAGLAVLLVLAIIGVALREWAALRRISRIGTMRAEADAALEKGETVAIRQAAKRLAAHYRDHPKTAQGRAELASLTDQIIDADDDYALHEKALLEGLDGEARRMVASAAKRVSIVTAVSPRALVDIGYVLYENIRLIRALAELYGGRSGGLGTVKLTRRVVSHLAVTGTLAAGDILFQQASQGFAAKLSARFGEGVLNGIMTARVGIAAIEMCRPAPFYRLPAPRAGDFMPKLLPSGDASKSGS